MDRASSEIPENWFAAVDCTGLPAPTAAALKGARLIRAEVNENASAVCLYIETSTRIPVADRPAVAAAIGTVLLPAAPAAVRLTVVPMLSRPPFGAAVAELIAEAWPDVLSQVREVMPKVGGILDHVVPGDTANGVELRLPSDALRDIVTSAGTERLLSRLIRYETGLTAKVHFTVVSAEPGAAADSEQPGELDEPDHILAYYEQHRANDSDGPNGRGAGGEGPHVLRGRAIPQREPPLAIAEITDDLVGSRVTAAGTVCFCEARAVRNEKIMVVFHITDLTDTVACRFFRAAADPAIEEELAVGAWVTVRGRVDRDLRTGEVEVRGDDITKDEKAGRTDQAPRKRVELHLHTTMSAMDGLCDPGAAVSLAHHFGHGAVAITDHGVVQGFPAAAQVKGVPSDFKVIYGCELFVVDDGTRVIARPPADIPLGDAEFVVLDIETTGLSAIGDDIIEIGAVRMGGPRTGERFQTFIRPTKPISAQIQRLTGITPAMVAGAPAAAQALAAFFAWCGEAILVAHNAGFDYSFLRHHREKHLGQDLLYPVLDTLTLARSVLTHLRRHGLADLCKELQVPLENHHRADADAEAAAAVLRHLLARAIDLHPEITEVAHLNQLTRRMNVEQMHPHHVTVLARRQHGIKNLYKLVSSGHTEYFYRTPRVPRSLLEQLRDGLLVGSGCVNGALFQALLRGAPAAELMELVGGYDYLEVQPPALYRHLVAEGQVHSETHLQELIRQIYALGQAAGKPVVATGDVHMLEPHQQTLRQILKTDFGWRHDTDSPCYFRTTEEMLAEFAFLGPEVAEEIVITNTRLVADLIEPVRPVPDALYAPVVEGAEAAVRDQSWRRAQEVYGSPLPVPIEQRLDKELEAIIGNRFAVIYYISQQLVQKSNELGYLVGSRGSVGSSFVAWCMGITEVNALPPHYICPRCFWMQWFDDGSVGSGFDLPRRACPECGHADVQRDGQDIPFETFMGFRGDKVPDIDLNFSGVVQSQIQQFSMDLLGGPAHVFKAGTVGTIAQKTAFGIVRGWAESAGRHLREAEIQRLATGLTGVKRTTGQHPGGMVVVPEGMEVETVTPVQFPADDRESGWLTTHFDYHSFEQCLLKLDILGHDDPTMLRQLSERTGIRLADIPMDDPDVLSLFRPKESLAKLGVPAGELYLDLGTVAVPEFGTEFVRRMLQETLPRQFSDLVRISGLSHGTDVWTNNAQELVRQGKANLQGVIPTRDDIMVYLIYRGMEPGVAFQIMESVRRGRGLTPQWERAMRECGVPDWYIWSCQQIKYMFPKAHAVAYCISSVRVAYFKVHHPKEFYAVYFTVRAANALDADLLIRGETAVKLHLDDLRAKGRQASPKEKEALVEYEIVLEALLRGIRFGPVDLLRSDAVQFQIEPDGTLLCPFNSLPGLGDNAARAIVEARTATPFHSVEDLKNRARLNRSIVELLTAHGCLGDLPEGNQLQFAF